VRIASDNRTAGIEYPAPQSDAHIRPPAAAGPGGIGLASWVTYLSLEMNPFSASPAQIVEELTKLGWKPVWGSWDFAWDWGNRWQPNANNAGFWQNIAKAHKVLQSLKVDFSFRTFEKGKETGSVWWH